MYILFLFSIFASFDLIVSQNHRIETVLLFCTACFPLLLLLHNVPAVLQKCFTSSVKCDFRSGKRLGGWKCHFNKVLLLICKSLQEALGALCFEVSASCLPSFLNHSFSSPSHSHPFSHHLWCKRGRKVFSVGGRQHLVLSLPPLTHIMLKACTCASPPTAVTHNAVPSSKVKFKHRKRSLNMSGIKKSYISCIFFFITSTTGQLFQTVQSFWRKMLPFEQQMSV